MAGIGQNAQTAAGNWAVGQGTNLANINTNLGNIAQQQAGANSAYYNDINNLAQQGLSNYTDWQSNRNVQMQPQYSSSYNYQTPRTDYEPGGTLGPEAMG